jgi:hypothetical protein
LGLPVHFRCGSNRSDKSHTFRQTQLGSSP